MDNKQCVACSQPFQPRPQTPNQAYCSKPDCQRVRRSEWQRHKMKTDPDYQNNQHRAQQAWCNRNPDYWRGYRENNPDYVEFNRIQQTVRNAKAKADPFVKMDASNSALPLKSGIYRLSMVTDDEVAKMNVWTVEITVHDCQSVSRVDIAKR